MYKLYIIVVSSENKHKCTSASDFKNFGKYEDVIAKYQELKENKFKIDDFCEYTTFEVHEFEFDTLNDRNNTECIFNKLHDLLDYDNLDYTDIFIYKN